MEGGFPSAQTLMQIKVEDEMICTHPFNNQEISQEFMSGRLKTEKDNMLILKSELIQSDIQHACRDVFSCPHSVGNTKEFLDFGLQIKKEAFDNLPTGLIPPIEMEEEEEFEITGNTRASLDNMLNKTKSVSKICSGASSKAGRCSSKQDKTRKLAKRNADVSSKATEHLTNKLHKEKRFSCDTCGKEFGQSALLTDHVKIHRRQKPYSCDQCDMKFAKPSYLKTHLRRHAGDRPFPCDWCEKRFFDIYDLRVHQRDHTGERPHICSECGKSFKRVYTLNKHKQTHSKEKPFQCSVCGKAYKYRYSYKLHMKDHLD